MSKTELNSAIDVVYEAMTEAGAKIVDEDDNKLAFEVPGVDGVVVLTVELD